MKSREEEKKSLFPAFRKRELKRGKLVIRKVHKQVVSPPGE